MKLSASNCFYLVRVQKGYPSTLTFYRELVADDIESDFICLENKIVHLSNEFKEKNLRKFSKLKPSLLLLKKKKSPSWK